MKIFYRTLFVAAISSTAFLVWGKKNVFSGDAPSEDVKKEATEENTAAGSRKVVYQKNDTTPKNNLRTAATASVAVTKTVDKTTAKPGDTLLYSVSVNNTGSETATGVTLTDNVDANTTAIPDSLWYSPIALEDVYTSIGNVGITVPAAEGVLKNDQRGIPQATLKTFSRTNARGSFVTLNADGSFDYTPAAGFVGTDTIQYILENSIGSDVGVISITIANAIWFINNRSAAAAEKGTLTEPFKSIANFQAVNNGSGNNPKPGQTIFIHESSTAYSGSLTLLNGQKLIGQDASTTITGIAGITLPTYSKALPELAPVNGTFVNLTSTGNTITLASAGTNYLIRGLSLGNKTGVGITGNNFGTLNIAETNITGTGQALSLSNGTIAAPGALGHHFQTLSSSSGSYGVSLTNVSGSLQVAQASSAIANSTTTAFYVSGGSISVQYPGTIGGVRPVDIRNTTNSTFAFSGNISSTSSGISLSGNTNGTITFSGAAKTLNTAANHAVDIAANSGTTVNFTGGNLVINTTTGSGIRSIGALSALNVTGTGNTITVAGPSAYTGGMALNISGATIGASGLTFQSIAASNAQKGIYLNQTGNLGGLTVTGTGNAASGGTIQNTALAGIEVTSATSLSLTNVNVVNTNRDKTAPGGLVVTDLVGTSRLENCNVTNSGVRNGYIINGSGTSTLRVLNCDFGFSTATVANDLRQDCFEMRARNNANATVILTNSQFRRAGTKGIQLFAENTATMTTAITNCTVDRVGGQMAGVEVGASQSAVMKANIDGNPVINATNEAAINVYAGGTTASRTEATVRNNTSLSGNGNINAFIDPVVQAFSNGDAKATVLVQNNVITNPDGQAILTRTTEGTGTMDATVNNNTITIPANGLDGIEVRAGADITNTTNRNCSYVHDNIVTNNGTQGGSSFYVQAVTPGTVIQLKQKSVANVNTVASLWTANTNTGMVTRSVAEPGASIQIGTGFTCLTPTNTTAPTQVVETPIEFATPVGSDSTASQKKGEGAGVDSSFASNPAENAGAPVTAKMAGTLSGETVTVSNITLPAGKILKVQFKVRVNTPFPENICSVINKASVSGSNVSATESNMVTTNILVVPVITTCQPDISVTSATCSSSQSFGITASGCPAPVYTYKLSNGDAITSPYNFPVGTTTVQAIATNVAGADTCTFVVTVTGTNATWTGVTSTDWATASNWSCGAVPDITTDVTIQAGAPNMPVITGNGGAKDITLGAGASLAVANNATLEVKGNFTNAGTLSANGTVLFTAEGNQQIPAATFNRLTLDGSGVKTVSGNVVINGRLSFADGMLATGPNLVTLGASADITGASATSFIITGNTGSVKKLALGTGGSTSDFVFPVGVSASSYTPATVSNTGTVDNFTIRLLDNVYSSYTGNTPNGAAINSMVVNRTWFVDEDVQGGSVVTLTLQWNTAEETPLFVRGMSYVAHNTGTAWLAGPTANALAGSEAASYTRTWAGLTYFSPFGVGSAGSALPVQLISFKGYPRGNGNKLDWTTSQEQLQRYEIERSGSQTGFVTIGEVRAHGGTATLSYNWVDASPLAGDNFYRLRMIHPDGKATYSDVVSINRGSGVPSVSVYPTPVVGTTLYLQLSNLERGTYTMTLYSGAGQAVFTRTVQHNGGFSLEQLQLPATLAKGAYSLQLTKGDQRFNNAIIIQ